MMKLSMRGVSNGRILLLLCILIVLATGTFLVLHSRGTTTNTTSVPPLPFVGGQNTLPVPNQTADTSSSSPTMQIAKNGGGTLTVQNFLSDKDVTHLGTTTADMDGYYVLSPPSDTVGVNPPYSIDYFPLDQSFNIAIYKEPLGEIRKTAAEELRKRLRLSQSDFCSVVVDVGTPTWVNSQYGARSLGLPGCPGSVALPGD